MHNYTVVNPQAGQYFCLACRPYFECPYLLDHNLTNQTKHPTCGPSSLWDHLTFKPWKLVSHKPDVLLAGSLLMYGLRLGVLILGSLIKTYLLHSSVLVYVLATSLFCITMQAMLVNALGSVKIPEYS